LSSFNGKLLFTVLKYLKHIEPMFYEIRKR